MNADPNITIMTSREFNQDTAKAKRAARKGPVYVTERGTVSHVLLTKAEYDRMGAGTERPAEIFTSIAEALADNRPEADFEWTFEELKKPWGLKVPDFD
jgi:PHD/YefM family antitoxin component YafN of YafNO toxin-antitoxin module